AELPEARLGDDLAERVLERFGRKERLEEAVELGGVLCHAERRREAHGPRPREALEGGVEQRGADLADAVGAEIRDEHPVAVLHPAVAADHGGLYELVVLAPLVALPDRGERVGRALAFGQDEGAPRL